MIKIVPWADRKLTKKSLAKIWNLFPNEEICMTEIPKEYGKFQWAKSIARYYILRGKDFSIEIDPIKMFNETEQFLKLGCKKFYFIWRGMYKQQFYSAMETLSYSMNILDRFPKTQIYIVYIPPYNIINPPPDEEWMETSIQFLSHSIRKNKNMHGIFRRPHPWFGKKRLTTLQRLEQIAKDSGNLQVENPCGCLTINSNTNIYCCPFCTRKKRKKFFGNAAYDKFVCGTVDRGVFRTIECDLCNIYQK